MNLSDDNKRYLIGTLAAVGVGAAALWLMTKDKTVHPLYDETWSSQYRITTHRMREIIKHIQEDMHKGLRGEPSTLKMLPTYVSKPTGEEKGIYLALDLGGTNFRVIKCNLSGGEVVETSKKQYALNETHMRGTAEELFNFIALSVQDFILSEKLDGSRVDIGFTFSFPVKQTGVASGSLIQWTKGFTTSGVEGHDVVQLLTEAFVRNNVNAHIAVLANDTVGTLVAHGYSDRKTEMGVILGTGTNACYAETGNNIVKLGASSRDQVINMEWGGFGDKHNYLPLSVEDKIIDNQSLNPGQQIFEKMISGMYLGEITRLFILTLIQREIITTIPAAALIDKEYKFDTAYVSQILRDESKGLTGVQKVLSEKFGINNTSIHDLRLVYRCAESVAVRAARLSGAAIVAVLEKINRLNNVTVAVDGSVFEHLPGFKANMQKAIKELHPMSSVALELTRDGSGNGAAIIASTCTRTM